MAGASLTIVNQDTNIEYKTISGVGEYTVTNLPPGTYSVRAELGGFKPSLTKDVVLPANRSARANIVLSPGSLNQTVEVTASAPVLNSENAMVGNTLQSGTITTVPLNGRTVDRLIRISAGVTTDNNNNPRVAGSPYWGGISFNVDSVGYNDSGNGGGAYSYKHGLSTQPSVDAIGEFKIDSNSMKAELKAVFPLPSSPRVIRIKFMARHCGSIEVASIQPKTSFKQDSPSHNLTVTRQVRRSAAPSSKTSYSSLAALKICWNAVRSRLPASQFPPMQ